MRTKVSLELDGRPLEQFSCDACGVKLITHDTHLFHPVEIKGEPAKCLWRGKRFYYPTVHLQEIR